MKHALYLLLALFMACLMSAQAQTATDLNEGVKVTKNQQTGVLTLTWWGKSGRTYFIQQSEDLMTWAYVPTIQSGTAAVTGLNFSCSNPWQFWRLRYTDAGTGGNALTADFDDDGLGNQAELDAGTDAFNPDSDNDGYYDGQEVAQNTNPNSAASAPNENNADNEAPEVVEQSVLLFQNSKTVNNDWYDGYAAPSSDVSWYDDTGIATHNDQKSYQSGTPRWEDKFGVVAFPDFSTASSTWHNTGSFRRVVNTLYEFNVPGFLVGRANVNHSRVGMTCEPANDPQPWQVVRRCFSYRKTTPAPYPSGTAPVFSALKMHPFSIQQ